MRHYVLDGHTHTLGCGHAYNTLMELVNAAQARGLELLCLTEHGPEMPGSISEMFFSNYRIIPPVINGVKVLKGIESNILDYTGKVDVPERLYGKLDIISASLHEVCIQPGTKTQNTEAVLGAIDNPEVDFLCHLGNPSYPLDYETILQAAKKHNKLIEINNASFFVRHGCKDNCVAIAKRCKELEIPVILGTDTHFCTDVGKFPFAERCLKEADFPDELIINLEAKRLTDFLEAKGRNILHDPREEAYALFDE